MSTAPAVCINDFLFLTITAEAKHVPQQRASRGNSTALSLVTRKRNVKIVSIKPACFVAEA